MTQIEKPFVGAYWSAREESRRECAQRIFSFLESLSDDCLFAKWCLTGRNPKTAKKSLELSVDAIEQRLKAHYTDEPRVPMLDLGFSLDIWNGQDASSAGFRATCGGFSRVVGNSAVLSLPRQEPPREAATLERLHALVRNAVSSFDPDVAIATSSEFNARLGGGPAPKNGGWITYRRGEGTMFRTPEGVIVPR